MKLYTFINLVKNKFKHSNFTPKLIVLNVIIQLDSLMIYQLSICDPRIKLYDSLPNILKKYE